ncbi:class I SAM-dependent methyltransferase [Pontibacter roseus]|uniref:class I SAM-dependent methyltransferase n=1 Tax=Pontibacter roseus TaxID=336989 RepID=UPI00035DC7E2|nr:class I SAM-dependent methyltransferase [Pontibacter roseus]
MRKPATTAAWLHLFLLPLCLGISSSCQAQQEQQTTATAVGYTTKTPASGGTGKVYLGREIAAIMSATGGSWLDRDTRQEEENSSKAIENMPLQPNSTVADIGAGTGYYTFQVAKLVPQGKVYAVEVQDRFIEALKERKQELGTQNVEVVKGGNQSLNVPDNSLDLAVMVDVYHELEYPMEMLQAIRKALKSNGQLLLMEYKAEDPDVRIRELHKMTVAQVKKELAANGFRLSRQVDSLPIQHFLLFQKDSK